MENHSLSMHVQLLSRERSSLIRVPSVCFHDKILSEVHLNICSRQNADNIFITKKIVGITRDYHTEVWLSPEV